MNEQESNWWGIRRMAHYFPRENGKRAMVSLCDVSTEAAFCQLNPKTGQPWPQCRKCLAKLKAVDTARESG